ncbi:MAG: MMPL family transporter [Thermoleophilaceae bacterium]
MTSKAHTTARPASVLHRLTGWVLAHKRVVVGFWIVLTLAGFVASGKVSDALNTDFAIPDSESFATNQRIAERFGSGGQAPPYVAVAELPRGATTGDPGVRADLLTLERDLREALPGARTASYGSTGDRAYVSGDGRTTFALAYPRFEREAGGDPDPVDPAAIAAAQKAVAGTTVGGAEVLLTGETVLAQGAGGEEQDGGVFNETLIAGIAALAVLAFVFSSALAFIPLVMAVVAIPTTMLAVLGLTQVTDVSFIVLFLTALIGLGIAIDYALIVVMRWREERDGGASNEEAVRLAAGTAGRAVIFSGTTVAIGLMATVVLPVPFLRSIGYGGLLIPLVSVAVALTLLPVVLAKLGPRADRRRLRRTDRAEAHWAGLARLVVRWRWPAAIAGVAVLVALCVVASGMLLGAPEAKSLAGGGQSSAALAALQRSDIGAGPIAPIQALTSAADADAAAGTLAEVDGVRAASAPEGDSWRRGVTAIVDVFTEVDTNSLAGRETVDGVREAASGLPSTTIGGATAQTADFVDSVYGSFPLMLGLISLVTFVLLARAFRSIVLPLKAIVLNLASVFATWGVMTLVWQHGFGSELLFGAAATGSVVFWAPMIVFAFIYGLSMDYEVFILARMREEYDRTGSTDQAVVGGIARTGRLVTSAALIVFFAFAALGTTGPVDVKMLATGLAGGVLLDALVVRTLLVPAAVSLFGRWNWWFPEPARRLLGVRRGVVAAGAAEA